MRLMLVSMALFAVSANADETEERASIAQTINVLNKLPARSDIFTADAQGTTVVDELRKGARLDIYSLAPAHPLLTAAAAPTITISHEPMGEATINFPGVPALTVEISNPRVNTESMRFITDDVAVAAASVKATQADGTAKTQPLSIVLKKDGGVWKIATVLLLAPR